MTETLPYLEECENCPQLLKDKFNYCPNCGTEKEDD